MTDERRDSGEGFLELAVIERRLVMGAHPNRCKATAIHIGDTINDDLALVCDLIAGHEDPHLHFDYGDLVLWSEGKVVVEE